MAQRNECAALQRLLAIFHDPMESVRECLLCCGLVGSLERDIDLVCVIGRDAEAIPGPADVRHVAEAIRECLDRAASAGIHLFPFTCFRTEVYIKWLIPRNHGVNATPFHLLVYPGIHGLVFSEWLIIAKSLLKSVVEIVPSAPDLLRRVARRRLRPLRERLWRYAALVVESQVLAIAGNQQPELLLDEVHHKMRYVLRFALGEYLLSQGRLSLADIGRFKPTKDQLRAFADGCDLRVLVEIAADARASCAPRGANVMCEATLRVLIGLMKRACSTPKHLSRADRSAKYSRP